jgi:hypothetical protein
MGTLRLSGSSEIVLLEIITAFGLTSPPGETGIGSI